MEQGPTRWRRIRGGLAMSVVWVLLMAAMGASPADSSQFSAAVSHSAAPPSPVVAESPARSAKDLRQAVAESLRRANSAKAADRSAAIQSLVDLFDELGRDRQLSATERQRLGAEVRSRLGRFATQFRHELTRSTHRSSSESALGAAGGPAVDGLDELVDLIQKTIGPEDWVLAQRIGGQGGAGQAAAGMAGQQGAGGGAFGGVEQQAQANGEALVDLIETTIAPDTWEIRG